ncbi:MAG: CDF family Co(II)/Ni(II) efflux transporter DmeF [Desulfobulbaceae bacterium]|uniref:CDF family Co(II)/Ni(II) efflux transporter DmeF n=1 Tax=Candidatus Desulfobia pelagia TaxID=2841692 RepID=A0A8J6TFQ6_9BACT|nr:CDF family Co(II)/Ni(II) efflux transporter DmeF [Candidatus Desulfobia pelagia]
MHIHNLDNWQHGHDFAVIHEKGEKRTLQVLLLTAVTMVVEIVAGQIFGSMALLADGWHMGTHVAAFSITIFAYRYAKRHADNPSYSFGTGKVSVLGGFASAVALVVVALIMAMESVSRLFNPQEIHFNEAIIVAILGLIINLVSAYLLKDHHSHDHSHGHEQHHHHDHNLKAAYFHVLADALTSVLAILALFTGKYIGWNWMDPVMGIVGSLVIARWSYGLIKDTSSILLDQSVDGEREQKIKEKIEADADNRVTDIHIWKLGSADYSAVISIVTHFPKSPDHYKNLLAGFDISHLTVEVNPCHDEPCIIPP